MDGQRYRQIRQIFDDALSQEPAKRREYLAHAASGDLELKSEVERLLAASERGTGVFEKPSTVAIAATTADRWEGSRLGAYELLSKLGEGGMGFVYLARRADGAFQKQVAIKIIRQQLATSEFLARFQREREILARLEHPHIARLLDGGSTSSGLAYLVMEYVQGEPLIEYADSRRLFHDDRVSLLQQVAKAVDYAHEQGVVHQDLKPSNILVSLSGEVKLLDFGIATWESEPAALTALSPAYASPEQALAQPTSKATDIYSLAMVCYELLAGDLPFETKGVALQQVLRDVAECVPQAPSVVAMSAREPLAERRRMLPFEWIDRLEKTVDRPLLRGLSKDPKQRQQSAEELLSDLSAPFGKEPERGSSLKLAGTNILPYVIIIAATTVLVATGEIVMRPFAWAVLALGVGLALCCSF